MREVFGKLKIHWKAFLTIHCKDVVSGLTSINWNIRVFFCQLKQLLAQYTQSIAVVQHKYHWWMNEFRSVWRHTFENQYRYLFAWNYLLYIDNRISTNGFRSHKINIYTYTMQYFNGIECDWVQISTVALAYKHTALVYGDGLFSQASFGMWLPHFYSNSRICYHFSHSTPVLFPFFSIFSSSGTFFSRFVEFKKLFWEGSSSYQIK